LPIVGDGEHELGLLYRMLQCGAPKRESQSKGRNRKTRRFRYNATFCVIGPSR